MRCAISTAPFENSIAIFTALKVAVATRAPFEGLRWLPQPSLTPVSLERFRASSHDLRGFHGSCHRFAVYADGSYSPGTLCIVSDDDGVSRDWSQSLGVAYSRSCTAGTIVSITFPSLGSDRFLFFCNVFGKHSRSLRVFPVKLLMSSKIAENY